jgi:hypothetical protein
LLFSSPLTSHGWLILKPCFKEANTALLSFVWMASTTASTTEVQIAAATPKEVLRLVSKMEDVLHGMAWLHSSTTSTWPVSSGCLQKALFGTFDMAWLGFIQHL